MHSFLSGTLHAGAWPFWNPYHYRGHPSVADPQSLIFSPLFFAWGALDAMPSMRAFDVVVLAHLVAGGIAMVFIGRRAGWPVASSLLVATVFMFGGPASARLQHTGISYSAFSMGMLLLQVALERRSYTLAVAFSIASVGMALGRNAMEFVHNQLATGKEIRVAESLKDETTVQRLRSFANDSLRQK